MAYRHAFLALIAAGAFGLAACETDNVSPANSGPATAGALNAPVQGSDSSGKPVKPSSPSETPAVPPRGP